MSVIWSGVTDEGAIVPVQVTAEGKVVAVGDGPEGDYLKLTGGNLTGDLTLGTNKIALNATDGGATFAGDVQVYGDPNNGAAMGTMLSRGALQACQTTGGAATYEGYLQGTNVPTSQIKADGSATFSGEIKIGEPSFSEANSGVWLTYAPDGSYAATLVFNQSTSPDYNACFAAYGIGANNPVAFIKNDGSALFTGDVKIGSRNKIWLIRESNGVAMLVEQNRRQPREEKLRDLPNELDLIEAALNEIMEKLRMTPPTGWPVWDGSDNA